MKYLLCFCKARQISTMLRTHQQQAIQKSLENQFQSGVHFHATGTGKSWVALQLILEYVKQNPKSNILWICEQKSILSEQFDRKKLKEKGFDSIFEHFLVFNYTHQKPSNWVQIINTSYVWKTPTLIIVNRAFLTSGEKYKKLNLPIHFIIHDECHSITNKTTHEFYQWILPKSPKVIGFSATPFLEREPFTQLLSEYTIYNAFCDQIIVPPKIQWWKTARNTEHPLSHIQIAERIKEEIQILPYKKIIVWCGMIEFCETLTKIWKQVFPDFKFFIDTSITEEPIDEFYQLQEKAFLFCACKHREGSDIPNLDGCIFLDKVEDRSAKTFIQCIGRVLRKDKLNLKKFGLIFDLRATSSMDVINRIQPFINKEIKFPWKFTTRKDKDQQIQELEMVKEVISSSTVPQEIQQPTQEEIRALFIRKIPEDPVYIQRLEEEMNMIEQKKLFPYILRAVEILQMTDHIPHVTRGSCGSSLVCYFLGISHVDPVLYDISFARFLNEFRNTLPDIDYDFPYHLRKDVFVRLEERYPGKIARISNHVHYHDKSAVREAIRSIGIHKMIPKHEIKKTLSNLSKEDQEKVNRKKKELDGSFRTYSLHCGGIVYYPDGVPEEKVLDKNQTSILQQITLNKHEVAKEKHFKIDILSSRAIAVLHEICGKEIAFENPILDENVFDMLCKGDNMGLTLAESPLMRKTLLKFQPRTMEALAMCLAIIRPAAKDARNADPEEMENEEMFVYDDDAIQFISRVVNCSEAEADRFRRCFAKVDREGMKYLQDLLEEKNVDEDTKKSLLSCLKNLSKYSFCKSHAFSYAQLVYQLAYYKYHRPQEFWTAVMKHSESMYKKWVHKYEARLAGVENVNQKEISIYAQNRRKKIHQLNLPLDQLKQFGYWTMKDDCFPSFCFMYQNLQGDWVIQGLITSYKQIRKSKPICILCLGIGKKKYIELQIPNQEFMHSKWIFCRAMAKCIDAQQHIYEAFWHQLE